MLVLGVAIVRLADETPNMLEPIAVVCASSTFHPGNGFGNNAANASVFFCPINCEARSSDCLAAARSPA